jgi:glutaminase
MLRVWLFTVVLLRRQVCVENKANNILLKALEGNLAIPRWDTFGTVVQEIYDDVKATVTGGANATYISVLADQDPEWFGVSVCTVDGQRLDIGDTSQRFCLQSCVTPLMYAEAVRSVGLEELHRHVGCQNSGKAFNDISLNKSGLPHNPLINSGAIATAPYVWPHQTMAERLHGFTDRLTAMAGEETIGFSESTYLCEQDTAYRNNALVYMMEDAGVFDASTSPAEALDFYTQVSEHLQTPLRCPSKPALSS